MIKNRQYTRTFTCQLTMEMIHNKLNEAFVKEIGWSNKLALEKETRRVLPDELRGTIQGTTNRNTMFEPAFIIKKNADNIFEFSYFIRGIIDSKMNDQDNVPTIV